MVDETQSDEPVPISRPTLRRLPDQGWIAGVCAGIADALGVPAWTIRAATILLSFTGFGIVAYILAALLMRDPNGARVIDRRGTKELVLYAAVAIVGWITLPEMIFGNELQGRASVLGSMFPWLLLVGGLALVLRTSPGDRAAASARMEGGSAPTESAGLAEGAPSGDELFANPGELAAANAIAPVPGTPSTPAAAARATRTQPIGSGLRWVGLHFPVLGPVALFATLAIAALFVGLGAPVGVVGGLGIAALGGAMLIASKRGRARGLVIPAAILTLLATPAVAAGVRLQTVGAPEFVQATATSAPADIHAISNGTTVIDLLDLKVSGAIKRTYEVAEGRVVVVLPARMTTIVEADVSKAGGGITVQRPYTSAFLDMVGTNQRGPALEEIRKKRLVDRDAVEKMASQVEQLDQGITSEPEVLGGLFTTSVDQRYFQHQRATYDPARRAATEDASPVTRSPGTLRLQLRAGRGEIMIVEPIWTDPPTVSDQVPTQICAEAGGAVGAVKSCSAIPFDRRVPTCLLEPVPLNSSYYAARWYEPAPGKRPEDLVGALSNAVGDCREIAKTKAADGVTPKVVLLACSDKSAYLGCTGFGIANDTPIVVSETVVKLGSSGYMVPASTIPPVQSPTSDPSADSPATVPPIGSSAPSATTGQSTTTASATTTTPTTTAPATTTQGAN